MTAAPDGRPALTPALVQALLAEQFPHWSRLTVEPVPGGWDNRSFRLGEDLVARLPSARWYAAQAEKEHLWLPVLAPHLPVPVPTSLALGRPSALFPWPWSVRRWLPGRTAAETPPADLARFAADLGAFLIALQRAPAEGAPAPGRHNFQRGGPLDVYDGEVRWALPRLEAEIDAGAAAALWEAGLNAERRGAPVWLHGDVNVGNLLVEDGRLSGVIDFGGCAAGDPACDLAIAWTRFDRESRAVFRDAAAADDGAWARGRAWALWKALIVAAGLPGTNPNDVDGAKRVLAAVLAEA